MPRDRADVVAVLTRKGFEPETKGRDHDWYFFRHPQLIRSIGTYVSRGLTNRVWKVADLVVLLDPKSN